MIALWRYEVQSRSYASPTLTPITGRHFCWWERPRVSPHDKQNMGPPPPCGPLSPKRGKGSFIFSRGEKVAEKRSRMRGLLSPFKGQPHKASGFAGGCSEKNFGEVYFLFDFLTLYDRRAAGGPGLAAEVGPV
jgi:hypothetical protein